MTEAVPNRTPWQWTPKRDTAALALAEGKTWKVIEEELGISHSTLALWVRSPDFQARVDEHVDAVVTEARSILRRSATKAARQMAGLLTDGLPMDTVKLAAAKDVLDRVGLKAPEEIKHTGALTFSVDIGSDDSNSTT